MANELDHRIKNLFALVNGLINLSVRAQPEMQPLADTLRKRLLALNRAHGPVRSGNTLSGTGRYASLKELISVLLRPYEGVENNCIDGIKFSSTPEFLHQ